MRGYDGGQGLDTAGPPGPEGPPGPQGEPGPNLVDETTDTTLTGILKGTGTKVAVATAPTDYIVDSDARLTDQRVPTDGSVTNTKMADMVQKTYKGRTTASTGIPEDVAVATLKTDLVLVKGDVGLGNVDNTSDANKPISTATQTALDTMQPLDADLTTIAGLTATTDNFMVAASSAWASRTPAQAKTSLALVKADVGLSNVDNTSDAGKPVSTATQTALDAKVATTRQVISGGGLTGGGDLSADRTLAVGAGTGITVNADDIAVNYGTTSITAARGDDARLSDARTPTAHAASHKALQSDVILLDELGAPTDITTLNATTAAHGLMQKYPGGTANFLRADGAFAAPTAAASISQTEIDFGSTPVSEASFLITDANVSSSSKLIGLVAYVAPTGKDLDELDMDGLDLKFAPGVGQFTLYARGLDGYVADKFKINYQIGA